MRILTTEEKAQCKAAKQRANKRLHAKQREIGSKLGAERLPYQFDMPKNVKGDPVVLQMVEGSITLNYEILRRFIRSLKKRQWDMSLDTSTGFPVLIINHYIDLWSKDRGSIELYELPSYQKELLTDLPIIEIET